VIEPVSVAAGERDVHPQRIALRVARDLKVQHVAPRGPLRRMAEGDVEVLDRDIATSRRLISRP